MNKKITTVQICFIAMAVCINVAGGQIALLLRLPVYLDSIGTMLAGAALGPAFGMIPNLLSGIVMGLTTDIYALYFVPVGMLTGLITGLVYKKQINKKIQVFLAAFLITVPGTIVSALICAGLFGGMTSSGSAVLVQLLAKTPLGMTASIFCVQILTDYLDRVISLFVVVYFLNALPANIKQKWKNGGIKSGSTGRAL